MEEKTMLDLTNLREVEVLIQEDGKVLWVNVDGICRLRACRIIKIKVEDRRRRQRSGATK